VNDLSIIKEFTGSVYRFIKINVIILYSTKSSLRLLHYNRNIYIRCDDLLLKIEVLKCLKLLMTFKLL
jgi:hypothetical protein